MNTDYLTDVSPVIVARRKEWVAALRSGRYPQTSNALRDVDGYCCLGVACEISGLGSWNSYESSSFVFVPHDDADGAQMAIMPPAVMEYYGVDDGRVPVSYPRRYSGYVDGYVLSDMNDLGMTFAQIADIIEREMIPVGDR